MIQPQELRYKNLVNYQGEIIEIHGVSVFDAFNSSIGDIPLHCLEPIIFSEEWAIKLGMKKEYNHYESENCYCYFINNNDDSFYINYNSGICNGWYVGCTVYGFLCSFKFVNQAQNLYFALTGKELEFKL